MALFFKKRRFFFWIVLFGVLAVYVLINSDTTRRFAEVQDIWHGNWHGNLIPMNQTYKGNTTGIPKIIHQIWTTEIVPGVFHDNIKGLVAHNKPPEWRYFFWTLENGKTFISKRYPWVLERFLNAPNLLKSDILRLAVLHEYGGVYFDLDTVSVKPLNHYVETHDCSLTTDPPEHAFNHHKPTRDLMITNSAILCQQSNWFILYVMQKISQQPSSCKDAISCTGPRFISEHYQGMQSTNRSSDLPAIEDYQLFEDMMTPEKQPQTYLHTHCVEQFDKLQYDWAKHICLNWIKRGKSERNISEKAYTYHTWFHTYWYPKKLITGLKNISELVPNVILLTG